MPDLRALSFAAVVLALAAGCGGATDDPESIAEPEHIEVTWLTRTCDLAYEDRTPDDAEVYVAKDRANVPIPPVTRSDGSFREEARMDLPLDGSSTQTPGRVVFCGMSYRIEARIVAPDPFAIEITHDYEGTRGTCNTFPPLPPSTCTIRRRIVYPSRLVVRVESDG